MTRFIAACAALFAFACPALAQPQTDVQKLFWYVQAHGTATSGSLAAREMEFKLPWQHECRTGHMTVRASEAGLQSTLTLGFEGAVSYQLDGHPYIAVSGASAALLVASGGLLGLVLADTLPDERFTLMREDTQAMLDACMSIIVGALPQKTRP